MNPALINWPAVLVAALSAFMVGGLWYNPKVFGTAWMVDSKLTQEEIKKGNSAKIFGFTALFAVISSANLAAFLATPTTTTQWGAEAGFLAGIWTFCAIATHSLFEQRSWRHIFINGGYSVISLTLMGAILGAWQ
jgi:phosphate-selective porin